VYAWKEGYAGSELILRHGGAAASVVGMHEIRLEPLVEIGGVIRTEAGQPVADACVFLWANRRRDSTEPVMFDYLTYTDEDGRWRASVCPHDVEGYEACVVRSVPSEQRQDCRLFSEKEVERRRALEQVWVVPD
jgi:hypothetical protein